VVEGGGLENHCARKGTGGSNPSSSVIVACWSADIYDIQSRRSPIPLTGSGNGVVRGAGALVLGLIATVLSALALARSRRTALGTSIQGGN
jgi:hypothetical protein